MIRTARFIFKHPLSKAKKFSRLKRYCRWQFGARICPGSIVVDFTDRTRLVVELGMVGATGNIYTGLHELNDMGFALHFLRPEDLFADIGANVGTYTVLASGHIGCRSVTVEPAPMTYQRLLDNIAINRLGDLVAPLNFGVGAQPSQVRFSAGHDAMNHVLAEDEREVDSVEVSIRTLDELLEDQVPALMKVDVEGFESQVVEGGNNVLSSEVVQAVLMELNGSGVRYGVQDREVADRMLGFGFRMASYDPMTRVLSEQTPSTYQQNTLFVRDFARVRQRLLAAPIVRGWWGVI
ncbi:MAG: FkbM family methyltransferase [bacterium]|nr:FkbM family methyltransferase [bacterium]